MNKDSKDNMCQIHFMCRDSIHYPCIYRQIDPKKYCKYSRSKTTCGVCHSSEARKDAMMKVLEKMNTRAERNN